MAKGLFFDLGRHSAGPAGGVASDTRIVSLGGPDVSVRADYVMATIDAETAACGRVHGSLERAFSRGSAADAMIPGEEQNYVSRALGQITTEEDGASVALALRLGNEVIVGSTNGASVYLFRDGILSNVT